MWCNSECTGKTKVLEWQSVLAYLRTNKSRRRRAAAAKYYDDVGEILFVVVKELYSQVRI